mmetsp:Transcript_23664/g.36352  ORF Transcript_23664/g.36352 Transcript_23664/m.36352 type:complete len:114 (+) Transcript_23664:378-719(+)
MGCDILRRERLEMYRILLLVLIRLLPKERVLLHGRLLRRWVLLLSSTCCHVLLQVLFDLRLSLLDGEGELLVRLHEVSVNLLDGFFKVDWLRPIIEPSQHLLLNVLFDNLLSG